MTKVIVLMTVLFHLLLASCGSDEKWAIGEWYQNTNDLRYQLNLKITGSKFFYSIGFLQDEWASLDIIEYKRKHDVLAVKTCFMGKQTWIYLKKVDCSKCQFLISSEYVDFRKLQFIQEQILLKEELID